MNLCLYMILVFLGYAIGMWLITEWSFAHVVPMFHYRRERPATGKEK